MDRKPILFLAVLFCICLNSRAQKGHFTLFRKDRNVQLVSGLFPQRQTSDAASGKKPSPLLLRQTEKKQEQDLFNRIIQWDCRIKFRLSSSLNLVVSYY